MAAAPYKLSCVLLGHELDVRSLAVTQDGCIVSGSRDKVAKLWRRSEVAGYAEAMSYFGHENFVNSVCVLPPSLLWKDGAIVTGSNDSKIRVFALNNAQPRLVLTGHTKVVCSVSLGLEAGTIVSSSWDGRACVWKTNGSLAPVLDLKGHDMAVWCAIQLATGEIVTGSADKTLKVWNHSVVKLTLKGHTDCVRGVVAVSVNEFLSCSNDATVKHWNICNGHCLATFYGHSSYIYSISLLPQGGVDSFVTSGEDYSVRIWSFGEVEQTITLPALSVWSTACLPNGDIVVGSSDGVIRVFSSDPSRQADKDVLEKFELEVFNSQLPGEERDTMQDSNIPGKEALAEPGKTDGQFKLVREDNSVICYEWSAAERKWKKYGDVMGTSGRPQTSTHKQRYNGKDYDYVFSVDVESGKPPLKLPYNIGDDPWESAHVFLSEHNLSPLFLDQVAEFIIKQCESATTSSRQAVRPAHSQALEFWDPLTGDSCYRTTDTDRVYCPENPYFPHKQFHRFDNGNLKQIQDKLSEFNLRAGDGPLMLDESSLQELVKLAELDAPANPQYLGVLKDLLELWPEGILFPVLDVTRLAIRNAETNRYLCSGKAGDKLFQTLQRFPISSTPTANQLLILRIFCNMVLHPDGEALAMKYQDKLLSLVLELLPSKNKSVQIALGTLVLNLAVAFNRTKDTLAISRCIKVAMKALPLMTEPEAQLRSLVALGTLLYGAGDQSIVKEMSSLDDLKAVVRQLIVLHRNSENQSQFTATVKKIVECAQIISDLLNK